MYIFYIIKKTVCRMPNTNSLHLAILVPRCCDVLWLLYFLVPSSKWRPLLRRFQGNMQSSDRWHSTFLLYIKARIVIFCRGTVTLHVSLYVDRVLEGLDRAVCSLHNSILSFMGRDSRPVLLAASPATTQKWWGTISLTVLVLGVKPEGESPAVLAKNGITNSDQRSVLRNGFVGSVAFLNSSISQEM